MTARDAGAGRSKRHYFDASVILRYVFEQPGRLHHLETVDRPLSSSLVELECLRTMDRMRLSSTRGPEQLTLYWADLHRMLARIELLELGRAVLARAAQPFPTPLGSLDAIHLATVLLYRDSGMGELVLATHDEELGRAARASGLEVIG